MFVLHSQDYGKLCDVYYDVPYTSIEQIKRGVIKNGGLHCKTSEMTLVLYGKFLRDDNLGEWANCLNSENVVMLLEPPVKKVLKVLKNPVDPELKMVFNKAGVTRVNYRYLEKKRVNLNNLPMLLVPDEWAEKILRNAIPDTNDQKIFKIYLKDYLKKDTPRTKIPQKPVAKHQFVAKGPSGAKHQFVVKRANPATLSKTKKTFPRFGLCKYKKENRVCPYGERNCKFAHSEKDIDCKNWCNDGTCKYGNTCKYLHDQGKRNVLDGNSDMKFTNFDNWGRMNYDQPISSVFDQVDAQIRKAIRIARKERKKVSRYINFKRQSIKI